MVFNGWLTEWPAGARESLPRCAEDRRRDTVLEAGLLKPLGVCSERIGNEDVLVENELADIFLRAGV